MSLRSPDDRRMFTRRSLMPVARAAALNLASSALVATDLSVPLSKATRISSSYASIFGIGFTLLQVVPCRFATGNDGLEEEAVFVLDERHQVGVVVRGHDKDALARVLLLVRMGQDVEQAACPDRHYNDLERNAPISLQRLVLLWVPPERLHGTMIRRRVPFVITLVNRIRPAKQSLPDAEQHAALVKGAVAVHARLRPEVVGMNDRRTWRLPSVRTAEESSVVASSMTASRPVSYTHLRAHETRHDLV